MSSKNPMPNPSHRRLLAGGVFWMDLILAGLAVVVSAACLNYLAVRHPIRMIWHKDPSIMLSPLTENWVRSLTNEVRVVVFHDPDVNDTPHGRVVGLLKEYRHANERIQLEVVDYLREREKAQEIRKQYSMDPEQSGETVLFAIGKRHRVVSVSELTQYDDLPVEASGQLRMKAVGFKGEMLFTSALMNLVEGTSPIVYFIEGHGEHDPGSQKLDGYASFKQVLEDKNIHFQSLNLREADTVPEDASATIIAGSLQQWTPAELQKLDRYMKTGGRLLVAFHFQTFGKRTGLENWLQTWGVSVGNNVIDDNQTYSGSELLVGNMVPHPVTNPLLGSRTPLVLSLPRSIEPANAKPMEDLEVEVGKLVLTTTNGVAKSEFFKGAFVHNSITDIRGSISLMTEVVATPSLESGLNQPASRMLVLGDSQFLSNVHIHKQGNRDFAGLAVNWLLERDAMLGGIGPRPLTEFRLDVPRASMLRLQWFMLAILPLGVFGIGFLVWLKRRY
ncbi:MAG: GldG family protein [Verrucomicrobia bacterium]|nr:GldG family protein [Verrucomicrobiota bacterium]